MPRDLFGPETKFVTILRDPISNLRSRYDWFNWSHQGFVTKIVGKAGLPFNKFAEM